jgi:5-carboxymethyl-2-hydroxymuconate isomerase
MGRYQCLVDFSTGVAAAERAARIDEVLGAERAAALLALVAVSIRIAAGRAGADDVPVGEELLGLLIVVLLLPCSP